MKLKSYIEHKKMSIQDLATKLDRPHETVRHWIHGSRLPRRKAAQEIITLTKGKVSLNDIYGET